MEPLGGPLGQALRLNLAGQAHCHSHSCLSIDSFAILPRTRNTGRVKISIVIPAFNEEKLIVETLRRIHEARQAFDRVGWESEVIVCDNNSTDKTSELARQEGAQVVFEPVNQIGRARNTGAAAATGDWLVFIDADSSPSADLFFELTAVIADGRWLAGGCFVRMAGEIHPSWRMWVSVWNAISWTFKWAAGSFVFCETRAYRDVEGFDTRLFVGEEVDLCIRLKKRGRRDGRGLVILTKHPLLTSARKLSLYSRGEMRRMMWNSLIRPRRFAGDRRECFMWYDGRR